MRSNFRYSLLLVIAAVSGMIASCSDDELANGGKPKISYIRVTDPISSDSLLAAAGQGQMVAIMGENLQDVREVWFNDQRAILNPSFITDKTVITRVPSEIPVEIDNLLKMVFANGESISYDFSVDISEPLVEYMKSEYVNTGDIAVISGNFFYEPLSVTFTGGVQGEIVSVDDQTIEVRIPDGVQPGPITVTTNFGITESNFWFRDDRNLFGSMDVSDFGGWWHGATYIVATDPEIEPISNKFLRINNQLGNGQWFEFFVGTGGAMAAETQKIPAEAILNPEDYSLKFELNTLGSLAGAKIHIYIGNDMPGERTANQYTWQPNINTEGEWQTVSIPFSLVLSRNPNIQVDPNGYGISFWFWEGTALHANFAMDNARVVPNINE